MELVITRGGEVMAHLKGKATAQNLIHEITAKWVRNKAEERIAQSKCIVCGEPLHKWDIEGEKIACTDCRDNEPPDQDNKEALVE